MPDDPSVRLVILGVDHAYIKGGASPAEAAAQALLDSRGTGPRLCRNAVVFLAPDQTRLQDLEGGGSDVPRLAVDPCGEGDLEP